VFAVKLGSIALALLVGVVVRRWAIDAPEVPPAGRRRVQWLAAGGLALWTVAIVTGRLMAYASN
jgi:hypothetical protein